MPRKPPPLIALLADFQRVCAELGVGWYLFGAQAALLYGAARLTADADITVQLAELSSESFVAALESAGFDLRFGDPGFVRETRVLPLVHRISRFPVDVVLGGPGLEEIFLARARPRSIRGLTVPVAAAEDLIAMKVLAGRPKDADDVLAIIAARGDELDLSTIRKTLGDLGAALADDQLLPAFERLLARAREA